MPESTHARRRRLGTRAAAAVAIALSAAAAILMVLAVLLDSEAVTQRVVDGVLPRVSERLGREVSLESARAKLLPSPKVTLEGLTIAGRKGEPPLLEAPQATVQLSLWTLLRSFGREVEVKGVRIESPELNLLRDKAGVWSFEGLGAGDSSEREVMISRAQVVDATVRVIDRSTAHGEAAVALEKLDVTVRDLAPGVPLQVQLNAAVASDAQNVSMDVRVDRSGEKPRIDGYFAVTRAALTRLEGLLPARLGTVLMGGFADLDGEINTGADGRWLLEADARLDGVRLRGEPASGSFGLRALVDPGDAKAARVEVHDLAMKGPGVDLGGRATFTVSPLALDFALQGPLLDLDALLAVLPEEEVTGPPDRTSMLPASTRRALDGAQAQGSLRVDRVVRGGLELTKLEANAQLRRGMLTLTSARATLYDGQVDASGSRVNLLLAEPSWKLQARLSGVDAGKLVEGVESKVPLQGRLDAALNLEGEGADWAHIQKTVSGGGALSLREGALGSTDLGGQLAKVGALALRAAGRGGAADTVARAGEGTALRDLVVSFRVADGQLRLREPLTFASGFGGARLDGTLGLDTSLALNGTAVLSPEFLAQTAGIRPEGPVEVPLKVGGTLSDPQLEMPGPAELAKRLAAPAAREGAKRVEEEVKRQARKRVGDVLRRFERQD